MTDSAEERPRPRPRPGPDDGEPSAGRGPRSGTAIGDGISPSWLGDFEGTDGSPAPTDAAVTDWPVWPSEQPPPVAPSRENVGVVALAARRKTRPPSAPQPSRSLRKAPRGPAAGFTALVLFGLLSAFFAWVTAEPFWLAVRHAEAGTATVTECEGTGIARRCAGVFASADGGFQRAGIPIMGADPEQGSSAAARMTSERGARAYVGTGATPRAAVGIGLLLLCGLLTAWSTGALRLPTRRTRFLAFTGCLVAPLLLLAGMLAATF